MVVLSAYHIHTCRGQKTALDPLELELGTTVSCHVSPDHLEEQPVFLTIEKHFHPDAMSLKC